jgi:hypothetical protein
MKFRLPEGRGTSTGAELRAKIFFERGDDFRGNLIGLRVGKSRFAALKRYAHE